MRKIYEENYTKAYRNQIAQNQCEGILKAVKREKNIMYKG